MPSLDTLLAFFGVSLLLGITPGPDNLFVLVQSAQRGWRAGMAVVVGLCVGLVVHTTAVALGLAALFAASATAFSVLKYVGAAYLAWLAWQALRPRAVDAVQGSAGAEAQAAPSGVASAASTTTSNPASAIRDVPPARQRVNGAWRMVGRGVVMNLTNPKIVIFFLAFLPQFADPARGSVAPQIMVLGLVFILAALIVFGSIAFFSGAFVTLLLRSPRAQTWLNRAAGVVFLGLAIRLATVTR